MFDFSDRVAVVTGAAGILGGAVAKALQAAGARLVLVDRAPDRLPRLFPELADSPDHFLATGVDLTDENAVTGMVSQALERFGRIDVLVNCAGGYRGGSPVHETPLELWDFLLDLNLRTAVVASKAVVPAMLQQGHGKIVNVAARSGLQGRRNSAAQSASKSGVIRLTECMSAELKKKGVHVNCIVPSTMDTPQNRQDMPNADTSRWVEPEALADAILFLASDAARAVHGVALPVYGTD
jgi:NAD(P)-dependent dehydrogenase (short-subunit alcohol dehydrogenase family)